MREPDPPPPFAVASLKSSGRIPPPPLYETLKTPSEIGKECKLCQDVTLEGQTTPLYYLVLIYNMKIKHFYFFLYNFIACCKISYHAF